MEILNIMWIEAILKMIIISFSWMCTSPSFKNTYNIFQKKGPSIKLSRMFCIKSKYSLCINGYGSFRKHCISGWIDVIRLNLCICQTMYFSQTMIWILLTGHWFLYVMTFRYDSSAEIPVRSTVKSWQQGFHIQNCYLAGISWLLC